MMRSMIRATVVVALAGLAACESSPPLGANLVGQARPDQAAADAGAPPSGGGPVNGDPQKTLVAEAGAEPDGSAPAVTPADPTPQISCEGLAAGGAPANLSSFEWQRQVADGPGSDAQDFVWIEKDCLIRYQHKNAQRMATMASAECTAARAWVTNAAFLEVLRTGASCVYGPGNPDEVFAVVLVDGVGAGRKIYGCREPALQAVRACLQPLVDRLFPN
jgi:hypothetical protein